MVCGYVRLRAENDCFHRFSCATCCILPGLRARNFFDFHDTEDSEGVMILIFPASAVVTPHTGPFDSASCSSSHIGLSRHPYKSLGPLSLIQSCYQTTHESRSRQESFLSRSVINQVRISNPRFEYATN